MSEWKSCLVRISLLREVDFHRVSLPQPPQSQSNRKCNRHPAAVILHFAAITISAAIPPRDNPQNFRSSHFWVDMERILRLSRTEFEVLAGFLPDQIESRNLDCDYLMTEVLVCERAIIPIILPYGFVRE